MRIRNIRERNNLLLTFRVTVRRRVCITFYLVMYILILTYISF